MDKLSFLFIGDETDDAKSCVKFNSKRIFNDETSEAFNKDSGMRKDFYYKWLNNFSDSRRYL